MMQTVEIKKEGRKGWIILNRPEKRNALNRDMISGLKSALEECESDEGVKVIILKANGPAFCSGADLGYLQELQSFSEDENTVDSNHLRDLFEAIYRSPKIVIAQVQGHALAGGCGLAGVCDFIFAVPEAKFGYTEVRIGFIPAIVMVFLMRKIGDARARKLLIGGELITSTEALQFGLVTSVCQPADLEVQVNKYADYLINANSATAMATTKRMMAEVQSLTLSEALDYAVKMNVEARSSADCKKGISAFLNKQDLKW